MFPWWCSSMPLGCSRNKTDRIMKTNTHIFLKIYIKRLRFRGQSTIQLLHLKHMRYFMIWTFKRNYISKANLKVYIILSDCTKYILMKHPKCLTITLLHLHHSKSPLVKWFKHCFFGKSTIQLLHLKHMRYFMIWTFKWTYTSKANLKLYTILSDCTKYILMKHPKCSTITFLHLHHSKSKSALVKWF